MAAANQPELAADQQEDCITKKHTKRYFQPQWSEVRRVSLDVGAVSFARLYYNLHVYVEAIGPTCLNRLRSVFDHHGHPRDHPLWKLRAGYRTLRLELLACFAFLSSREKKSL